MRDLHFPRDYYDENATFPPGDPENPRNWPAWRKWLTVAAIIPVDLSVSWGASGFSPAMHSFREHFSISTTVATLGLSLYILGLAFGPMSLAPLSEFFGRSIVYNASYAVFLVLLAVTALVDNLVAFMVLRFLSGLFACVTVANFGGTIADLWPHYETGVAMSLYLWAATCGSPSGFLIMSLVAEGRRWQDVFWALFTICSVFWIIMLLAVRETRHTTILKRRRRSLARSHRTVRELFQIALARPFRFLATEAIVIFAALYHGYLFGLSFLFNGIFMLVFGHEGHGFSIPGVGFAFLGLVTGISAGVLTNTWQERRYLRAVGEAGGANIPEARVHLAKTAAVLFPVSMFCFAWTTFTWIPPIVPILVSGVWGWCFYTMILMTVVYIGDSYGVYSASALAGTALIRNIAGAAFPLFGHHLMKQLGFQWGATLLAVLGVPLVPIPFVLARYGPAIRRRSPWASQHMDTMDVDGE
ncbi:major facilitator superfamily domain-containing protein [Microdochium trichocladiopsis]|uniref:Major facilitator superfamily domain-containing protein n=1 Tax=Microdochium trichocladiopsis TaxID=1682393 RepID=A0A9P9BJ76_9PEZI|nr:major facilitator superfamily domain-containing protein [Microdochium trichocladiopsis]KAH7024968.1 major facilitator superfamily domain-containing protein [Microdochium trichocladiopsis]